MFMMPKENGKTSKTMHTVDNNEMSCVGVGKKARSGNWIHAPPAGDPKVLPPLPPPPPKGFEAAVLDPKPVLLVLVPKPRSNGKRVRANKAGLRLRRDMDLPLLVLLPNPPKPVFWVLVLEPKENPPPPNDMLAGMEERR